VCGVSSTLSRSLPYLPWAAGAVSDWTGTQTVAGTLQFVFLFLLSDECIITLSFEIVVGRCEGGRKRRRGASTLVDGRRLKGKGKRTDVAKLGKMWLW
jgi:hypothetical protein